jgi:ribosomal protein L29
MKKADKIAYQQKTPIELKKELLGLNKQLIELTAKHHTGNQKDTSVFKKIKYQIALITTILNQPKYGKI